MHIKHKCQKIHLLSIVQALTCTLIVISVELCVFIIDRTEVCRLLGDIIRIIFSFKSTNSA